MPRSSRVIKVLFLWLLLPSLTLFSQENIHSSKIWKDYHSENLVLYHSTEMPLKYRTLQIQSSPSNTILGKAPQRFSPQAGQQSVIYEIPYPNGEIRSFQITKTNVMHPDLAAKYPEIQTFHGVGIENKNATLSLSKTPSGIRATVIDGKNKIRIQPYSKDLNQIHISYYIKDLNKETFEPWECKAMKETKEILKKDNPSLPESAGDCQLRTYRLALACTGGYAQKFGGTKNSVMAELVSTVSNLNAVLEREVGIFLEMVPDNDDLIFLNANTDGYMEGDRSAMINENVDKCNAVIGSSNYDIGHLFSITGGGLAGVGVVCGGSKARAVSGLSGNPSGYYFETIVLHEMGHQFSAGHTQNNDCNRSSFSAMETGSGSTLMSYAGVCAPNVQFPSDDYYHSISLQQIQSFTILGLGSNCPTTQDLGNIPPNVDAGLDYILPTDTYFELEGTSNNPDNDDQTFVWDQMDNEAATAPPVSNSTEGPTFRSIYPTENPIRTFPNIDAIVEGTMPNWEVLPSVERDMNFRFNVRDLHNGIGCAHEDDIELTFWDPPSNQDFRVIDPETVVTWFVGDVIPVQWSPAQTYESPVECERINIYLSKDGGYTYPILLAENVLNEPGEYQIMVPNEVGTQNRIKVKCSNNVFFDISNTDFSIEEPPVPTFLINASPQNQAICGMELSEVSYEIELTPIAGFSESVSFSAENLPNGAVASFSPETIVPGGIVEVTISNLNEDTEEGDFEIIINANSTSQSRQIQFDLQYFFNTPNPIKLVSPSNGASLNSTTQNLVWLPDPNARGYQVEVATNPSFDGNIIHTGVTEMTSYQIQGLEFETVYYWRIKGMNLCGEGESSMSFAFQTPRILCETYGSENVPVEIPGTGGGDFITVTSSLNIPESRSILDLNILDLNLEHNYVGDMSASLSSPLGTSISLFEQPGAPATFFGCNGRNMEVSFDDDATLTQIDLEGQCDPSPPTISGIFRPLEPLSTFHNEDANGAWTLTIDDFYPSADGGNILGWMLEVCSAGDSSLSPDLLNEDFTILKGTKDIISNKYLGASKVDLIAENFTYTILSLPENGILSLNDIQLNIGDQFNQEDIDNESVTYEHDDSDTETNQFYFDVLDTENGWVGAQIFHIDIISLPVLQATLVTNIDCHNNDNGSISAQVSGGTPPFEYSLDGVVFQNENSFENLTEGTYTIIVRDANDFESISNEVSIINPDPITATSISDEYDIIINAVGGTGVLTYSSDGVTFQNENLFNFSQPSTNMFIIQDENGCQTSLETMTSFSAEVNIIKAIDCFGGNDGAIEINVVSGASPFEYSIDGQPYQAENIFDNLSAGTYSFSVKDEFGNEISANGITIESPEALTLSVNSNDFEIIANGNGGTGNLAFSINGIDFQNDPNFTVQNNGNYTVTVQDENGCTLSLDVQISVNTLVVSADLAQEISCYNGSDGSISANVSGGTAPFQYSINGIDFQNENTFGNLSAGTYNITILDAEDFTRETNEIILENPAELTLMISSNDFEIIANGSGGTGNLEYSINGTDFQNDPNFTVQNNGIYTITARDELGCLTSLDIQIAVNTLFAELAIEQEITCHDSSDAILWIGHTGGTSPYQYSLDGINFQNQIIFFDVAPGTYTGIVMDSEGFTFETNEITVIKPDPILATTTVDVYDIVIEAEGGWGNFYYQLNDSAIQTDSIFECNAPNTYTIKVVDEKGCPFEIQDIEVETPEFFMDISVNEPTCYGANDGDVLIWADGDAHPFQYSLTGMTFDDSQAFTGIESSNFTAYVKDKCGNIFTEDFVVSQPDSLTTQIDIAGPIATIIPNGGTPPYQFSLDGMPFTDQNEFGLLPTGAYSVEIMDSKGCTLIETFEITYEVMTFQGGNMTQVDCDDTTVLLEFCVNGGQAPYDVSTNPSDITVTQFSGNCAFNFEMDVPSGTYEIIVSDAFGITTSNAITFTLPNPLEFDFNLDGNNLEIEAQGGTPPFEFLLNGIPQPSNVFENLPNGDYTIGVIDANGCSVFEEINITKTIEVLSELGFEIMPNPNDGKFFLKSKNTLSKDWNIKIIDVTGRLVFESNWSKAEGVEKAIYLNDLANGVYQLILENEIFLGTEKIVIIN